jgi:hypothetical protein
MVGHVLYYSPSDPDGLWIHHSIAEAMNGKDAKNMRVGYRILSDHYKVMSPLLNCVVSSILAVERKCG